MGRPKGSKNVFSTRITHICETCHIQFSTAAYRKDARFCSMKCLGVDKRGKVGFNKGRIFPDSVRKKMSDGRKSKCVGENNNLWKGGRRKRGYGYIAIYSPNHPFGDKDGNVMEHRLVMEKHLGRYLKKEEVVHHINEIRDDNRIENLMLFPNNIAHIAYHRKYIKNWKG